MLFYLILGMYFTMSVELYAITQNIPPLEMKERIIIVSLWPIIFLLLINELLK
jgi:hypothetical protein